MTDSKPKMSDLERRRIRMAMATHIANGLIIASGEDYPDVEKLAMRTVKTTDRILAYLEQTEDGNSYPDWW